MDPIQIQFITIRDPNWGLILLLAGLALAALSLVTAREYLRPTAIPRDLLPPRAPSTGDFKLEFPQYASEPDAHSLGVGRLYMILAWVGAAISLAGAGVMLF